MWGWIRFHGLGVTLLHIRGVPGFSIVSARRTWQWERCHLLLNRQPPHPVTISSTPSPSRQQLFPIEVRESLWNERGVSDKWSADWVVKWLQRLPPSILSLWVVSWIPFISFIRSLYVSRIFTSCNLPWYGKLLTDLVMNSPLNDYLFNRW